MASLYIASGPSSSSQEHPDFQRLSRHELFLMDMSPKRDSVRTPRRSHTVYDYQIPDLPQSFGMASGVYASGAGRDPERQMDARIPSPIAETAPAEAAATAAQREPDTASVTSDSSDKSSKRMSPPVGVESRPRRPALPPPRRSYSVMDYEPLPRTHRPSAEMSLADLPGEIHYAIFDFLDPIDGTCLGLTNKHFYAIHRRMHGRVPLSVRREGPNDMEWAWHLAGTMRSVPTSPTTEVPPSAMDDKDKEKKALAMLRVRGQAYCRKCGISRCELHKHIQSWMPDEYEYCSVRQKFGAKAPDGAKNFCYLSNPKKPGRCGRHRVAKTHTVPPPTSEAA